MSCMVRRERSTGLLFRFERGHMQGNGHQISHYCVRTSELVARQNYISIFSFCFCLSPTTTGTTKSMHIWYWQQTELKAQRKTDTIDIPIIYILWSPYNHDMVTPTWTEQRGVGEYISNETKTKKKNTSHPSHMGTVPFIGYPSLTVSLRETVLFALNNSMAVEKKKSTFKRIGLRPLRYFSALAIIFHRAFGALNNSV